MAGGAEQVEHKVISEIYAEDGVGVGPPRAGGYVTTKFYFRRPAALGADRPAAARVDSDGDLVVERRARRSDSTDTKEGVISIEHSASTSIRLVGLQVWRGALLLGDWALHYGPSLLCGSTVLEMGAGTGLTSIAAAISAKEVISTDVDIGGILDLIRANSLLNGPLIKAKFTVLALDFFAPELSTELLNKLAEVTVILAADVVYDVDLTEAFVQTLLKVMSVKPKKTLYFALEKRYVFTTDDLESVAPIYEHFLSYLDLNRPLSWTVEHVPLDFPQYFQYDRVKQLVLWKISS